MGVSLTLCQATPFTTVLSTTRDHFFLGCTVDLSKPPTFQVFVQTHLLSAASQPILFFSFLQRQCIQQETPTQESLRNHNNTVIEAVLRQ